MFEVLLFPKLRFYILVEFLVSLYQFYVVGPHQLYAAYLLTCFTK